MRKVYLPSLKKLRLKNYTLYPNGLDYEFDFINGVNLIIGGNGMGKTTMVNLIKYAIIGHYRKRFDYTRTYKGKSIEKRKPGIKNYFKNRLDPTIDTDGQEANITIEFEINSTHFVVNRNLSNLALNYVHIIQNDKKIKLEGKLATQEKYEGFNAKDQEEYLFYKYEKVIEKHSMIGFDDLIFFVNEILFFGESHKTILWDDTDDNVQDELFNKFFNSPELEQKRQEALRKAKYYDSRSRHKSEDIRAIKKVLDKVKESNLNDNDPKLILHDILTKKESVEKIDSKLEKIQSQRLNLQKENRTLQKNISESIEKQDSLDKEKNNIERQAFSKRWINLHNDYAIYFNTIKENSNCPMCQNELSIEFVQEVIDNPNKCFLCTQNTKIITDEEIDSDLKKINDNMINIHKKTKSFYYSIAENDETLEELDSDFNKLKRKKRKILTEIRQLEYSSSKDDNSNDDNQDLKLFYEEIEDLENEKKNFQLKSIHEKEIAQDISKKIEEAVAANTHRFSNLFANFAGRFLGVTCSLSYTGDKGKVKRFYPKIDGVIRTSEEELSESQRFFVDHSFRMSILTFFYTKPTFYIVETPDSSLDISYEENAVNVFMDFLKNPNSLIITTNLNNSHFFQYLIKKSKRIKILDLLSIAKQSEIQSNSSLMKDVYNQLDILKNGR